MAWIFADEHGREHFVDMSGGATWSRAAHCLADADQSVVGGDAHDHRALAEQRIIAHAKSGMGQFSWHVAIKGVGE